MSGDTKVHGMDGSLVAPDWPPLTLAEIRELLEHFPQAGAPVEISFTSPRPLSAAAVVNTSRGGFFVKRHSRLVRDRAGLVEEHKFMEHLRVRGVPVPRVVVSETAESAVETGDWAYEVHELGTGMDIYADAISWTPFFCAAHAREAGRMLAKLHLAAGDFVAQRRKAQPLVASFTIFAGRDCEAGLMAYLKARPALAHHDAVKRSAEDALEILSPYHAELVHSLPSLKPHWTHNDLHASNLFWSSTGNDAKATEVIDFGLSDQTNAVHDLANAVERNMVGWLALMNHPDRPDDVPVEFDHLSALLAGYEEVRPLTQEERAALAPMTALCHAEFALSEADYFLGVLHSEQSARVAYQNYLVGHACWYTSKKGTALLDTLRRWADNRKSATRGVALS